MNYQSDSQILAATVIEDGELRFPLLNFAAKAEGQMNAEMATSWCSEKYEMGFTDSMAHADVSLSRINVGSGCTSAPLGCTGVQREGHGR